MRKVIIGVMGPGTSATQLDTEIAFKLGAAIAAEGYVLLTGGRNCGVMDAASKGAKSKGGLTIGVLPGADINGVSDAVDIPIVTGMQNARNNINVLSSQVIIACGMGAGTLSEVMLAVKSNIPVFWLNAKEIPQTFLQEEFNSLITCPSSVEECLTRVKELL